MSPLFPLLENRVLLDYSLPKMNGLEVLERMRELGLTVPVVMATGQGDERIAVHAMNAGAIDYVIKTSGYFATLPTVLNKVLKQHELAVDNARLYAESRRQQARLGQIFHSTSDGIVLADRQGVIVTANRRAGEDAVQAELDPVARIGRRGLLPERPRDDAEHGATVEIKIATVQVVDFHFSEVHRCKFFLSLQATFGEDFVDRGERILAPLGNIGGKLIQRDFAASGV